MSESKTPGPLVLMILDGWGQREPADDNAISLAATPNWDKLWDLAPHCTLETSGEAVGLPPGQMGNSEVGHMNIGAGRIVYQDFTKISRAIEDGSFRTNPALCQAVERSAANGGTVHIMGLLSPGGVHSHEDHFLATVRMAARQGARDIAVHAFLDGRDTPPRSAGPSIERMQELIDSLDHAAFGVVAGRYYAMDRDRRWERVQRAWEALVNGEAQHRAPTAATALVEAYARDEGDEFVQPTLIGAYSGVRDGDAVIFVNFRADRARELTQAFVQEPFEGFERRPPRLSAFVCMTEYLAGLPVDLAFPGEKLPDLLGEVLARNGLRQLRIAETEKYAHVTFFLNGGQEQPFADEDRILVPSPKVATYDLQPEMSAPEVARRLDDAIRSGAYDVIVCNIANPDMVGHTGRLEAAVAAVEAVDSCLGTVRQAVADVKGELLITADHGNIEQMCDTASGQAHTAHTTNPVPFVFAGRTGTVSSGGSLRDIAPTILYLLGLPRPEAMTGRPLVRLSGEQRSVA
jgi:2,3-bisphosphoglycerate-independent phosphoglycerate mutase